MLFRSYFLLSVGCDEPGFIFGLHAWNQYSDVIWAPINGISTVCSTTCSDKQQRLHQSPILLAHSRVDSPHKVSAMRKDFPCPYVIMINIGIIQPPLTWFTGWLEISIIRNNIMGHVGVDMLYGAGSLARRLWSVKYRAFTVSVGEVVLKIYRIVNEPRATTSSFSLQWVIMSEMPSQITSVTIG